MRTYPRALRRRETALTAVALAALLTVTLAGCGESAAPEASAPKRSARPSAPASADPSLHMVARDGRELAFHVTPGSLPAIVLDSGGGMDASQWKEIVPALAKATGSKIITYDRAGMGESDEVVGAWSAENAAADLAAGLAELRVTRDVILVAHSQGGEVATYFADKNPKTLTGAVLVDAGLPGFYTDDEVARLEAANKERIAQLEGKPSTKEIRQLLATADDFGPMHRAYHELSWPKGVPVTVMASSKTPFDVPEDAQLWRDAQAQFADAAPDRELVVVEGSSHDIPADRPQSVVKAVEDMVKAHS